MKYIEFPEAYFSSASASLNNPTPTPNGLDRNLSPLRRNLANFIKKLPQGAVVLDAGCGNGKAIRMMKVYRPDVKIHAIDISDVSKYLPKDIQFQQESVEEIGSLYKEEMFDAIVCLHVIEHLPYPMKMMESFNTVLKKGGTIFMETPNWIRLYIPFSTMFFWNDYTHVRPFSKYGISQLFKAYGFGNISVRSARSHQWFTKKIRKSDEGKSVISTVSIKSSLIYRIVNKLINPLLKDTLIIEAKKTN